MLMKHDSQTVAELSDAISKLYTSSRPQDTLPPQDLLQNARQKLMQTLPTAGLGLNATFKHLTEELAPGFNESSRSSNYYGFVTGGSTPVASLADNLVTLYDQNVQVHLPNETVATNVEDAALSLLCELLRLEPQQWPHRTFTTGATASNIIGLACGREYVIAEAAAVRTEAVVSVGDMGIFMAMRKAGIDKIQILTTVPHSSIAKAASILGLGRASVKTISKEGSPHRFDMAALKRHLEAPTSASIVVISAAEVNSGLFATSGEEMAEIRKLCDHFGAWIHVDAAFGLLGRLLESSEYDVIMGGCANIDLADSITGDCHKLLNVPYDCGFFLSRHRELASHVFQNPNAAYLTAGGARDDIMSPLNIGIENSRRFRALPVYASLVAYGRDGYRDMLERQIGLARGIAQFFLDSDDFELLPQNVGTENISLQHVYVIVLFRATDGALNEELVGRIKSLRTIYVSGTAWEGRPACRFAVSNWQAHVNKDLPVIKKVLMRVVTDWKDER